MLTYRDIKDSKLLNRFMTELDIPEEDYLNLPLEDVLDIIEQDFSNKVLEEAFSKVNEDTELVLMRRIILDNTLGDIYYTLPKEEIRLIYENLVDEKSRKEIENAYSKGLDYFIDFMYDTRVDSKYTRFLTNALASYNVTFEDIIQSGFNLKSLVNKESLSKINYEFMHLKKDVSTFPLASLSKSDEETIVEELGQFIPEADKETLLKYYASYVDDGTKNEILNTNDWLLNFESTVASRDDSIIQYLVEHSSITEADALTIFTPNEEIDIGDYEYILEPYDWGKDTTKVIDFLVDNLNEIANTSSFRGKSKRFILNKFYTCLSKKTRLNLVKKYKYL